MGQVCTIVTGREPPEPAQSITPGRTWPPDNYSGPSPSAKQPLERVVSLQKAQGCSSSCSREHAECAQRQRQSCAARASCCSEASVEKFYSSRSIGSFSQFRDAPATFVTEEAFNAAVDAVRAAQGHKRGNNPWQDVLAVALQESAKSEHVFNVLCGRCWTASFSKEPDMEVMRFALEKAKATAMRTPDLSTDCAAADEQADTWLFSADGVAKALAELEVEEKDIKKVKDNIGDKHLPFEDVKKLVSDIVFINHEEETIKAAFAQACSEARETPQDHINRLQSQLRDKEVELANVKSSLDHSEKAAEEKSELIKQLQSQLDAYDRERAR